MSQCNWCDKKSIFGKPNTKIAICCKECNTKYYDGKYVDVKHSKCTHCHKRPSYGYVNKDGTKKLICCKDCNIQYYSEKYVDIANKRCTHCPKRPNYGKPGTKTTICCSECNKKYYDSKYVDVTSKKCKMCAKKVPIYGKAGTKITICCKDCNIKYYDGKYVDVKNLKCTNCKSQPRFGLLGTKIVICCSDCNIKYYNSKYVDIVSKRCTHCDTIPTYGELGTKIKICCSDCNIKYYNSKYVDIKNKRCKTVGCESNANRKYKDYCFNCFIHNYPDHKISRDYKSKERRVVEYIKQKFPEYNPVFDKPIGSSKKRPDCYFKFDKYIIIVEIDENQHKAYDCDDDRSIQLLQDAGMNLLFIRFNPDGYVNSDGIKQPSCFRNTINGVKLDKAKEWDNRLSMLGFYIQYYIEDVPDRMLTVKKLFYDGYE